MKNSKINIIVATHKEYVMPMDSMYIPVEVGAALNSRNLGYVKDNDGENISSLNSKFSELTALYWGWKNVDSNYLGISHYRRHFSIKGSKSKNKEDRIKAVLTQEELVEILNNYDGIVPKKRNYYIETLYSHYKNTLYIETLDTAGEVIGDMFPNYIDSFNKLKTTTKGYMFNMMVLEKTIMDRYLNWLFPILFEVENRIGHKEYSAFHNRYPGRVSELLFNVWLDKETIKLKEVKLLDIEPVNWRKKGLSFLKSKFIKKKYEGSF